MQAVMQGARLAYVVVPVKGKVKRNQHEFVKNEGIKVKVVDEAAGFMVFFPQGHTLRMKDEKSLREYGLDKQPRVIDLDGIHNPESPIGQMIAAQTDAQRALAYQNVEQMVIDIATARTGKKLLAQNPEPPTPDRSFMVGKADEPAVEMA